MLLVKSNPIALWLFNMAMEIYPFIDDVMMMYLLKMLMFRNLQFPELTVHRCPSFL